MDNIQTENERNMVRAVLDGIFLQACDAVGAHQVEHGTDLATFEARGDIGLSDRTGVDITGAAEERGSGPGLGYNHNFPLPTGTTTDDVYCETLQNAVDVIGGHTGIDYVLVR